MVKTAVIKITDDPPENSCKPSVDYLFRSVAHHYVGRATGVIMTGMGSDGTQGLKLMKQNGSRRSSPRTKPRVWFSACPEWQQKAALADAVLPLDQIADMIAKTVRVG
jgi:two-component system chemotaxis response regulator CheB